MFRLLCVTVLVFFFMVIIAPSAMPGTEDFWKSPKPALKRVPSGKHDPKGRREHTRLETTYHEVTDEVFNLRCLLGGGRKIIRHDCAGEDPQSIEVVFTRDVDRPEMMIHDALSWDNGATWSVVGPLSADPDNYRDRSHCISFCRTLTFLGYQETDVFPLANALLFTSDLYQCFQAFNPFTVVGYPVNDWFFLNQVVVPFENSCHVYWSFVDFSNGNPYTTYVRRSTDAGQNWSAPLDITDTIGADGFDMAGMDGPLMMDADGEFVAALAMVGLDPGWAADRGLLGDVSYPAYTQSTDGGITWEPLRLVWGNDGAEYPQGHSGDPDFDETIHYVGGVQDLAYTAFNNCQDNVAVTPDGLVHLTYTMRDTMYGYEGVFHTLVDDGTMTGTHIGWPENPDMDGESGFAYMPSIAKTDDSHIFVGWTEFIKPVNNGDICVTAVPAGQVSGSGPVNLTHQPDDDITYQRIVDRAVHTGNPEEYYIDWVFQYYDSYYGGGAADSTLWHLQATVPVSYNPLIVEVTPDADQFPRGGVLGCTVTATNRTTSPLFFQGWTEGETPAGSILSPLLGPTNWVVGTEEILTIHISQRIPDWIEEGGPYIYRVKTGDFPGVVYDADSFEFDIVSPEPDANRGERSNWEIIE